MELTLGDLHKLLTTQFEKLNGRLSRLEELQGFSTEELVRKKVFGDVGGLLVQGLPSLAATLVRHADAARGGLIAQFIARVATGDPDARQARISLHVASVLLRSGAVASVGLRAVSVLRALAWSKLVWSTSPLPSALKKLRTALPDLPGGETATGDVDTAAAPAGGAGQADASEAGGSLGAAEAGLGGEGDERAVLNAAESEADASGSGAGAPRHAQLAQTTSYSFEILQAVSSAALELGGVKGMEPPLNQRQKSCIKHISTLGGVLRRFCAWLQAARLPALSMAGVVGGGAGAEESAAITALAFDGDSPAVAVLAYLGSRVVETKSAPPSPQDTTTAARGAAPSAVDGGGNSDGPLAAVWRSQIEADVCGHVTVLQRGEGRMPAVRVETGEIKTSSRHAMEGASQGLLAAAVQALAVLCLAAPALPAPVGPAGAPESPRQRVLSLRALLCVLYPGDPALASRATTDAAPLDPLIQLSTTVAIAQRAPQQPQEGSQVAGGGLITATFTYYYAGAYGLKDGYAASNDDGT